MNTTLPVSRWTLTPVHSAQIFHYFIRVLAAGLAITAYNFVILYAS